MADAIGSFAFFDPEPMVVGHRGNPTRHPDNTLAGVLSGLEVADAVEVDVRMSSDGLLVLAHDPYVGGKPVHATPWADLVGSDGRPLCQLEEALAVPGRVCIEVKNIPGEEGFDPHGRVVLLAASRARPTDVIAGFYWPDLDLIRSRAPEVATCLVVGVGGSPADAVSYAGERGHAAISVDHTLIDGSLLELASAAGVRVMAWTVDDPRRARELFAMGVTAIISDDPESLRDVRSAR
ncbi:MAG: glycerophosphodiester phosphodiesterase [Actinomycetes bacterium]|nr:glycerophosphodiester phosphodiesterase [Acidimicrobiia bacterium]